MNQSNSFQPKDLASPRMEFEEEIKIIEEEPEICDRGQ